MALNRQTLLDIAQQQDPDGKAARVIEVLNQMNPIVQDAPAYPANAPMGNRVTRRSSLPTVAFGKVNKGTTRSKSTTVQRTDTIGIMEGLSEVDAKLRKIHGASKFDAVRAGEDRAFLESMAQLGALTLLYGDELTSESSFTGLAPRLGTLATAITGSQVKSNSTVSGSDGTSMFIVDWGENTAHLIFPEDSVAGVEARDMGELRVDDEDGNPYTAFVTKYEWLLGLTVKDPRHIARLANVDISAALADTSFTLGKDLIKIMTAMPDPGGAQRVIYTHQSIVAAFYIQALEKSNAALSIRDYLGKPTAHFWEYPIRRCDQMSGAESTVS